MNIYLDMDGVLADFSTASARAHNVSPQADNFLHWHYYEGWGLSSQEFWKKIDDQGEQFWLDIPLTPDAGGIYRAACLYADYLLVLTQCKTGTASTTGKIRWIERHFPALANNILPVYEETKAKTVLDYHDLPHLDFTDVLIDDRPDNCEAWIEAGGTAYLYPRPHNASSDLYPEDSLHTFLYQLRQETQKV